MPACNINNVRLAGLSAAVPVLEECSWEDLDVPADAFRHARRRKETPCRRIAKREQCQSDLCIDAARALLPALGWEPSEIGVIVMATLTGDFSIPATAIIVQDRLGVPATAVAFDIPSGPIGFLHGLQAVAAMLNQGCLKKGLLLAGQVGKTPVLRDPAALFADIPGHCGVVAALEFSEGAPPMFFDSGGDGAQYKSLFMPMGGVRVPPAPGMYATPEEIKISCDYVLDSTAIAAATRRELPASVRRLLDAAGASVAALDAWYFPLMGYAVESSVRGELGIPWDKFHASVPELGFGGSGAVPLAMLARGASQLRNGRHTSLLGAMGAGIAWASALVTTENLVCPDILEL